VRLRLADAVDAAQRSQSEDEESVAQQGELQHGEQAQGRIKLN